jgi:outer membrane protein assembly factor BamA
MGRRTVLFILLGVIHILICSSPIYAQIPRRLERCLPYPTLAEEIKDMQDEVEAKERKTPQRKVVIDDVNFDGPIHLPNSIREQLITELKQREFDGDYDWLGEIQEVPVRGAWQDQGYFRVNSTAQARIISSDSTIQHVSVIVHVDEGLQYRLGDVSFREGDPDDPLPFPAEELRKLVPLREGDLFNVEKIREGLEALKKLYDSNGYIDFTASPDMEVDEASRRISLVMVLDQQKQYRVGKVEILGVDARTASNLRSKLKPGDIFNSRLVDDFLKENKAALPADASPRDIEVHRDVRNGTVDARADFRTCQQPQD